MPAFKIATRVEDHGEIHLSSLPFQAGEEVEIVIFPRKARSKAPVAPAPFRDQLPPKTRSLLGVAKGASEEDYHRYLEEKYR